MQHYIDITLLPNDEIGHYFLWGKLYQQVHLALVEQGQEQVGVSFPEYSKDQPRLGRKLRLFARDEQQLIQLNLSKWLNRLADYCHISSIRTVPTEVKYVIFSRMQNITNPERLARRRAKRKSETFEQAMMHFSGFKESFTTLPFVELQSLSTSVDGEKNHKFKLFIDRHFCSKAQIGAFSSYGLSKTATIPWF
jgi:CRISPR-associated endonuclease Csy4